MFWSVKVNDDDAVTMMDCSKVSMSLDESGRLGLDDGRIVCSIGEVLGVFSASVSFASSLDEFFFDSLLISVGLGVGTKKDGSSVGIIVPESRPKSAIEKLGEVETFDGRSIVRRDGEWVGTAVA